MGVDGIQLLVIVPVKEIARGVALQEREKKRRAELVRTEDVLFSEKAERVWAVLQTTIDDVWWGDWGVMGEHDIYFLIWVGGVWSGVKGFLVLLGGGNLLGPIGLEGDSLSLVDGVSSSECEEVERSAEVVDGSSREMVYVWGVGEHLTNVGLWVFGGVVRGGDEGELAEISEVLVVSVNEEKVGSLGGGMGFEGFLDLGEISWSNWGMRIPDTEVSKVEENICVGDGGCGMSEDATSLTGVSVPVSDECDECAVCVHRDSISYLWRGGGMERGDFFQKILESSRGPRLGSAKFWQSARRLLPPPLPALDLTMTVTSPRPRGLGHEG